MNRRPKRRLCEENILSSASVKSKSLSNDYVLHPDLEVIDLVSPSSSTAAQSVEVHDRSGSPLLGSEPKAVINVEEFCATSSGKSRKLMGGNKDTIDLTDSPTALIQESVRLIGKISTVFKGFKSHASVVVEGFDEAHRRGKADTHVRKNTFPNTNTSSSQSSNDDDFPQYLSNFSPPTVLKEKESPEQSPTKQRIQCPVCLDNEKQIIEDHRQLISTTCGHIFCNTCINKAVKASKKCPKCRKNLTLKQLHPIFL